MDAGGIKLWCNKGKAGWIAGPVITAIPDSPMPDATFDLKELFLNLAKTGAVSPDWYLIGIEVAWEIHQLTEPLVTDYLEIDLNDENNLVTGPLDGRQLPPAVYPPPSPPQDPKYVTLPGNKPTRIDVGSDKDYTAADGTVWLADRGFIGGKTVDRGAITVAGTKAPALFRTERYGMSEYRFNITPGVYTVKLHLAETWKGVTAAGQRVFDVDINGQKIPGIDIFAEAKGANKAIVKSALVGGTDGTLRIQFRASMLNAKVDALEIIPAWEKDPPATPTPASSRNELDGKSYDWTTSVPTGFALKRDGLAFYNSRWAGEKGSIYVKYGPPTCTWWSTHEGPADPTFPVGGPNAGVGTFWETTSDNSPLPIKLCDLEVLKASFSATLPGGVNGRLQKDMPGRKSRSIVPAGSSHMYRVRWQLYFSDSPTGAKYNKGDFAPTVFAVNCSPTWWGSVAGSYESGGRKWKMCDARTSSGMGRYIIPLLDPYLTPDAEGRIELRDVDIKAMIDWCIARGFYDPEAYLVLISLGWEIWVQDQNIRMNDMAFTFKQKGRPPVTIPAWSRLMKK
jgi:hypothetical protein